MNSNLRSPTAVKASSTRTVEHLASSRLPTRHGEFSMHVFQPAGESVEHVAIVKGNLDGYERVLVRVHSECLTGDVLGSTRCDCGNQLDEALSRIAEAEQGVVVYLRGHEGRGIGLANKIRAYQLQDQGRDTVDANLELGLPVDTRDYQVAASILRYLGVRSIRLMTNNPHKVRDLADHGVQIDERVPVLTTPTGHNIAYLRIKQDKLGHLLNFA